MKIPLYLFVGVVAAALCSAALRPPAQPLSSGTKALVPVVDVASGPLGQEDSVHLRSVAGGALMISYAASGPLQDLGTDHIALLASVDERRTERLVTTPTAIPWKHPYPCQPSAMILRVAERTPGGKQGPVSMFTGLFEDHAGLPVISILVPEDALFDPDTGIYVSGNAVMHPTLDMWQAHQEDGRWWKYPGNYHFRGKAWERQGLVQFIDGDGQERYQTTVRMRVNGQMTRGFPQHALRMLFEDAIPMEIIGGDQGTVAYVLRAAGNDQMKAMMRDALAHRLCEGAPFEVSAAMTCAVYINGAYWGLHQLRPRMDEKELARRAGTSSKDIALVEVRSRALVGRATDAADLRNDLERTIGLDASAPEFVAQVEEWLDLEGFLQYMACVLILDNQDWPHNNVKIWRYTGKDINEASRDGRWRFILNDMDLGLGAYGAASLPLFERVKGTGPVPDLFRALMGSREVHTRFDRIVDELLAGPLSPSVSVRHLDAMMEEMAPEVPRHIARWREPSSTSRWRAEVERIRAFLVARPDHLERGSTRMLP